MEPWQKWSALGAVLLASCTTFGGCAEIWGIEALPGQSGSEGGGGGDTLIFGGGGITQFGDVIVTACGSLTPCSGDQSTTGYTFGAAYWVTPWLAAEGAYIKPGNATAGATADTFKFDSEFDAQVLMILGKVGIPLGPFRPYGQVGASFHEAKFHTNQTMTNQEGPSNTLTYELRTNGWSWGFGGGMEVWFSSVFGLYGEVGTTGVKGPAEDNAEGAVDDRLTSFLFGARVRLGG